MDITFPIIRHTKAKNIQRWARMEKVSQNFILTQSPKELLKEIVSAFGDILATIVILFVVYVLMLKYNLPEYGMAFLMLLGFCLLFTQKIITYLTEEVSTFYAYKHFNERLVFSKERVSIISPLQEQNHTFLYKDISNIHLLYKAVNDKNLRGHIGVFTWEKEDKRYEYAIPLQVFREEEMLMNVLADLYEKKIKIRETNEDGEQLYLLRLTSYKGSNIDKKYIDLIEEIGEKED